MNYVLNYYKNIVTPLNLDNKYLINLYDTIQDGFDLS
jgi:hypothetical protein